MEATQKNMLTIQIKNYQLTTQTSQEKDLIPKGPSRNIIMITMMVTEITIQTKIN